MTMNSDDLELRERLNLIETMIAEGKQTTENWGWVFVLWGVAYYVAIGWSMWGGRGLAWPVTMVAASAVTGALAAGKGRKGPSTTMGRAIASLWIALGVSMFIMFLSLGMSGRLRDPQVFVALAAGMLGMANAASGMILRWKLQLGCAVVWWAAVIAACFGTANEAEAGFVAAIFFCQILFGIYITFNRASKVRQGASHA